MKLRRTSDVTDKHCTKVHICQGDGPYDQPLLVQLSDVEFIMGDIPVTADRLTFLWNVQVNERTFVMTQNARMSHISALVNGCGIGQTYTMTVYVTYPEDNQPYPIDVTGIGLTNAAPSDIWLPPANNLVFPSGTAIILHVDAAGGGPYNAVLTTYIVLAPAVV